MLSSTETLVLKNPNDVSLTVSKDGKLFELLVVQSIQLRIDENKKPIYGFNDRFFHKVLSGKTICSGVITIKKYSKDALFSAINTKDGYELKQRVAESVKSKVDFIYELLSTDTNITAQSNTDFLTGKVTGSNNEVFKKFNKIVLMAEVARRTAVIKSQVDLAKPFCSDDLLTLGQTSEISLVIDFNNVPDNYDAYISPQVTKTNDSNIVSLAKKFKKNDAKDLLILKNLHFISKQENVMAGDSDIDEHYEFIANIDQKRS